MNPQPEQRAVATTLIVGERHIALDKDGFLCRLSDWDQDVAEAMAERLELSLSAQHWEILWLLRQFYQSYQLAPAMRALVKYIGQHLGQEKGNSIYLLKLFPGSPAKLASLLAGLPKPDNCL